MDYANRTGSLWLDGELVPWAEAKVHVLTHTLHYGLGCYEGIRAYQTDRGPAIFRLDCHIKRLQRSAKLLQMSPEQNEQQIIDACTAVVAQNNLQAAYIRPMFFYGSEGMGLHAEALRTHCMVAAWEWGKYLGADSHEKGVRIKTSSYRRIQAASLLTKAKANGHYINSMLALQEAKIAGFDEALMLDNHGFVAEGSGENFFMVQDGVLHTPTTESILVGITRDTVMKQARQRGLEVVERRISRDEVYTADEAFFTGTAAEITPIVNLDGYQIGAGKPGPITLDVQQQYFATVCGKLDAHQHWLTYLSDK